MNTFNWLQVILPVAASAILPLLALLATPVGLPVLSWLIGTRAGRVVAGIGIVLMMSWLIWRAGRQEGWNRSVAKHKGKQLEDLATKLAVDEELQAMTPSERRNKGVFETGQKLEAFKEDVREHYVRNDDLNRVENGLQASVSELKEDVRGVNGTVEDVRDGVNRMEAKLFPDRPSELPPRRPRPSRAKAS